MAASALVTRRRCGSRGSAAAPRDTRAGRCPCRRSAVADSRTRVAGPRSRPTRPVAGPARRSLRRTCSGRHRPRRPTPCARHALRRVVDGCHFVRTCEQAGDGASQCDWIGEHGVQRRHHGCIDGVQERLEIAPDGAAEDAELVLHAHHLHVGAVHELSSCVRIDIVRLVSSIGMRDWRHQRVQVSTDHRRPTRAPNAGR